MKADVELTTEIGDGITQIRLPMAGTPLRHVNGYLVEDDDGPTLIDCGWKADDVLDALLEGLRACGRTLLDVQRLVVTHHHFDHYGLAGALLRAGVPELCMHRRDWETAVEHLTNPAAADLASDGWLARNGYIARTSLDDGFYYSRTELTRPTRTIDDGDRIGRLRAVWTPGHTPGHLCFVDTRSGRMFTGDHVLDPITPHVGIWVDGHEDPLGDFVASLRKVAAIGAAAVLPAHREPFPDLQRRVGELLAHHEHREQQVLAALASGPYSAATVARALTWTRRALAFDGLGEWHQQFAVAETLAHLERLRALGAVTHNVAADPILYATA